MKLTMCIMLSTILTGNAWARLGETEVEAEQRYGTPLSCGRPTSYGIMHSYRKGFVQIRATYFAAKSGDTVIGEIVFTFESADALKSGVEQLLEANSSEERWRKDDVTAPTYDVGYHRDGASATVSWRDASITFESEEHRDYCIQLYLKRCANTNAMSTTTNRYFDYSNLEVLREQAEQGDAKAQLQLGYRWGESGWPGVNIDLKEAVKWFSKSADQGNADAQSRMGYCYQYGIGVERDSKEAAKWYAKAAEQGDGSAQLGLGLCYKLGMGVETNLEEAVRWYTKAAEQGYDTAQYFLGLCYMTGEGVGRDFNKAVEWFRKSADKDNASAQSMLAVCYRGGEGVAKDLKEAVKWFKKSADQGNAEAQCGLGCCFAIGEGVVEDSIEAYKWLLIAGANGNEDATVKRRILEKRMSAAQIETARRAAKDFVARKPDLSGF